MARITIVGTGLIGTSLAMALRKANLPNLELVGTDSDGSVRRGAEKSQAFHRVEARLLSAINETDILVFATPVMAIRDLMEAIGSEIPPGLRCDRCGKHQEGSPGVGRRISAQDG